MCSNVLLLAEYLASRWSKCKIFVIIQPWYAYHMSQAWNWIRNSRKRLFVWNFICLFGIFGSNCYKKQFLICLIQMAWSMEDGSFIELSQVIIISGNNKIIEIQLNHGLCWILNTLQRCCGWLKRIRYKANRFEQLCGFFEEFAVACSVIVCKFLRWNPRFCC